MTDPIWDPNNWAIDLPYRAITLSLDGHVFTIVDADRYDEIMANGPWSLYEYRTKKYARRARRRGEKGGATVYLHRWLAERHLIKPSPRHIIVDHKYGNGLDNRLEKLIWCTPRANRLNIYGMWWQNTTFLHELDESIAIKARTPIEEGLSNG
jgi:hypothetical protein